MRTAAAARVVTVVVIAALAAAAAATAAPHGRPLSPSDLPAGWAATLLAAHPLARADPPLPAKLVTWYQLHLQADVPSRVSQRHAAYEPGGGGEPADSHPFAGWDLLKLPAGLGTVGDGWLRLELPRAATLCLAVAYFLVGDAAGDGAEAVGTVRGDEWVRVGTYAVPSAARSRWGPDPLMVLPAVAGVYCKAHPAGVVALPQAQGLAGFEGAPAGYDLLLGEVAEEGVGGGGPAAVPRQPTEYFSDQVTAGAPCPAALHDLWSVTPGVTGNADTDGKAWATWHPALDPIFYCQYGHEHGSSPARLPGIPPPAFGLVAWANGREAESHTGFKGYAFRTPTGEGVYLTAHIDTASLRRAHTRLHTVSLAVVTLEGRLVMDTHCKGDFGFAFTLPADFLTNFRPLPLGATNQALWAAAEADPAVQPIHHSRRMTVVDPSDPGIDAADLPVGRYEQWRGGLGACTTSPDSNAGLTIDIQDPLTACPSLACPVHARPVALAPVRDADRNVGFASRGLRRSLTLDAVTVGRPACRRGPGATPPATARGDRDRWWSDPACTAVLPGPARGAVRQLVAASWAGLTLDGKYASEDSWSGWYSRIPRSSSADGMEVVDGGVGREN
ncbi:hypothetical protein MMPV_008052 [Pyropia vietnamensis]